MLSKPTNPTPYLNTVDAGVNKTFHCDCVNSEEIEGVRFILDDGKNKYFVSKHNVDDCDEQLLTIENESISINNPNVKPDFSINNTTFVRTTGYSSSSITFANLLREYGNKSWQLRLYEKKINNAYPCNVNIGYGFVQDVTNKPLGGWEDNQVVQNNTKRRLKVRPHTNMFVNSTYPSDSAIHTWNALSTMKSEGYIYQKLTQNYDDNVEYKISINGNTYPILAYYYGKSSGDPTIQVDSYGQPLFAYIEIDTTDTIVEGDEYTIYTNYIDSDEFAFSVDSAPDLWIYYGENMASIDVNNPTSFDNADLELTVKDNGIDYFANYYKGYLYDTTDGSETLIYTTDNIYKSTVTFKYNRFETEHTYKLVIEITDGKNRKFAPIAYIKPNYGNEMQIPYLKAEEYVDNHSIVVDVSDLTMLNAKEIVDGGHSFYTTNDIRDRNNNALPYCSVNEGNTLTIGGYENGLHVQCIHPVVCVVCKGHRGVNGKILRLYYGSDDYYGFSWYDGTEFGLSSGNVNGIGWLMRRFSPYNDFQTYGQNDAVTFTDEQIESALSHQFYDYSAPLTLKDTITYSDDYYWNENNYDPFADFWWKIVWSDQHFYIKCLNPPHNESWELEFNYHRYISTEAPLTLELSGNIDYQFVGVWNNVLTDETLYQTLKTTLPLTRETIPWKSGSTLMESDFSQSNLSFNEFGNNTANILRYRLFKKYSNQPTLHFVGETSKSENKVFEDFMVGSMCDYTYKMYPILLSTGGIETYGNPLISNNVRLDDGIVRVIGLKQDETDLNTYMVDTDNIWHIWLNVSNNGFTNNLDKTFNDTQNAYSKESTGRRKYRTIPITGLLGKFDCETQDYVDTYDDIIEWENFINNGEMKALIDLRGVTTIGDIEGNSFEYDEQGNYNISVNFNFRQLADIEDNNILAEKCLVNPINVHIKEGRGTLLADIDNHLLTDSEGKYLIAQKR